MEKANWPAWYYGPNGASAMFESASEVPSGWVDHPSKVGSKPDKQPSTSVAPAAPAAPAAPTAPVPSSTDTSEIDADGHPWNADIHAASRSKTKAGLWRMKVGATRPAPLVAKEPAPLDL